MRLERLCACLVLGALACFDAFGAEGSRIAEAQFRSANPCPVTGQAQGPCTGYVIDRVIPLACGGTDQPDNMRWITLPEAKAKAKWDRIGCRPGRRLVLPHEMKSMTEAYGLGEGGEIQSRTLGARETDVTGTPAPAAIESSDPPVPADEAGDPEEQDPHE